MAVPTLQQASTRSNDQDVAASHQSNSPYPDETKDTCKVENATSSRDTEETQDAQDNEANELTYANPPKLSLLRLFWYFFYNFGLFAWGGPVAQIALIKEQIVIKEKWITLARFQRVFAVYQILPGPEAAELCMFFGCLSAGRIGGIIAGLGFILPGFILMLVASYLYTLAGLENNYFNASFRTLQPIVAAMVRQIRGSFEYGSGRIVANMDQIFKATHKIADHSLIKQSTKKVDPFLVMAAICTAINSALHLNMLVFSCICKT
jgi:chromate transport protein ChrA